jgi:hypothetical protein
VCTCSIACATVVSANWPNWRGPTLNGVSTETGCLHLEPDRERRLEAAAPAFSGSTPIIWGDRVFLNVATARDTGALELWAIDRTKQDVVWKRPLAGGNNFSASRTCRRRRRSPTAKRVWVMTGCRHPEVVRFRRARNSGRATSRKTTGTSD